MKVKSFSELGDIYATIASNEKTVMENTVAPEQTGTVLLTDASVYVPVKEGTPLGGGPGAKKDTVPVAPKTGPKGLKGNNFEAVSKKEDPGSDAKVMKKEAEEEKASDNAQVDNAAKNTTPAEKVKDSVVKEHKYNYNPRFTMAKLKFDQLYQEAINSVPFTEEDAVPGAEPSVAPADDAAADSPEVAPPGADEVSEDVTFTLDKETARKLCDALKAVLDTDEGEGVLGGEPEEDVLGGEEPEGEVAAEAIVCEPTPKEEKGNNAALQGKNNQVGDLKKAGAAEKSTPGVKSDPTPKEEKGNNSALQGKNNKVGNLSPGKRLVD
jgi:hypothetical protein